MKARKGACLMTRRPLCMLCLILMLSMCATDWAGIPLIRGNPLPENAASWIEEHPQATLCGEVIQTTENEFSQSVYLSNAYLIYQSQKLSIENVKVFLKQREEVPAGTVILVSGKLKRVEEKRNPGEFDSQQYYASQHIYYLLNNAEIIEKSENYSEINPKGLRICVLLQTTTKVKNIIKYKIYV